MSSGLSLGQARALLPTAALSAQNAATAALAAPFVNAATSWLLSHGKWRGAVAPAVFTVYDNTQVTLPRGMLALLGGSIQGTGDRFRQSYNVSIRNEWYQWIEGGPGIVCNPPYDTVGVESQGDGFVLFRDLPSTGTIKVYNSTSESAGAINIRGYSGGAKVYTGTGAARVEGENVAMPTTASTSTTTATTWDAGNSLYGIVKPSTNGVLNFYHVSADTTETLIGTYEPGEKIPCYRRYYIPQRLNNDGQLVAICNRRHVDVVVDNDAVIPGNLNALEMALMAVNFRRKAEDDRAKDYMQMAMDELNSELLKFEAEQSYGAQQIDESQSLGSWANLV